MGRRFLRCRRGIIGIEAAIILIAFVIIAAAFAFMAINMGLFATQRSKDTISQGLREASSPLQVDGNVFIRVVNNDLKINATIIPLRAMGVKYVPVGQNETVVSLSIVSSNGNSKAYANIYYGVNASYNPTGQSFDNLALCAYEYAKAAQEKMGIINSGEGPKLPAAVLIVENSDGDEALDAFEKGFLVILLDTVVEPRAIVTVEIRVERSAPLTIEFMVPESLTKASWMMVSG
ncbi:MAG: archaellin/type IV pilin N-terminal domain-containing protein [Candidatus Bathyarchaeia archaeon]